MARLSAWLKNFLQVCIVSGFEEGKLHLEQYKPTSVFINCDSKIYTFPFSPERASQIVAACAILHNIATIRKERVPAQNQLLPDETDLITLDHPASTAVRDAITIQYFT